MKVKIKILDHGHGLKIPSKSTLNAACVDLYAAIQNEVVLTSASPLLIPCGFCLEIPVGYEAQIRPRSGLALKNMVTVLNTPGTIDSDYRGEVCVILLCHSVQGFIVRRGDRIAQMAIRKTEEFEFEVVDELSETKRAEGGFGSTGVN